MTKNEGQHIGDRIRAGLEGTPHRSQAWLAREVSRLTGQTIRPQQVYKWIHHGKVSRDYVAPIAKALNLRTHWVLTGDGPMLEATENQGRAIPLIKWEELTNMEQAAEKSERFTVVDCRMAEKLSGRAVSAKPGDASMKDEVRVDDTVVADPGMHPIPGCIVIVALSGGRCTMGYYHPHDVEGSRFTIEPANKDFPAFRVPDEVEAEIIAVVPAVIRNVMPGF